MDDLIFKQILLGPMANFVYLIGSRKTREAALVDPAWDIDALLEAAAEEGLKITDILVTHTHPDHVGGHLFGHDIEGVAQLLERVPARVHVHKTEAELFRAIPRSEIVRSDAQSELVLGDLKIRFIHTPGHTPGSQCFLLNDRLVSGDTLFIGTCGRCDLPGSSPEQLYESLTQKLMQLDEQTIVFPGHNYAPPATSTTIAAERDHNPFFSFPSRQAFLAAMGVGR
jgi:glyoxylase-like metal-dependent hydrolase (beta-lactamase superfamily II)